MKQIVQWPDSGVVEALDVPRPAVKAGFVLVRSAYSAISPGTERSMVEFGRSSMLSKARARPDLVRRVIQKASTEGIVSTIEATRRRLQDPTRLGYSCAGEVVAVGPGVSGLRAGDRVACGGAGYACHAEYVAVPSNLVVPLPEGVSCRDAAFTVIATIPMHGFRLSQAGLGDTVVILGLGLIGQLACQIAAAAGSHVIAFDPNEARCRLAETVSGVRAAPTAAALTSMVAARTHDIGADAVLICAATSSSEPIATAASVARDRARIVMVGATGMQVPRRPFFEKELTFVVSRSYGPGRYDPEYEERGHDYPPGFVRWTERRNMDAVVSLLEHRQLDLSNLGVTEAEIEEAAQMLAHAERLSAEMAVVVRYQDPVEVGASTTIRPESRPAKESSSDPLVLGLSGAGQFARATLLPAIRSAGGFDLHSVTSAGGLSAAAAQRQFGFTNAVTTFEELLDDPVVGTVVIATRHDLHADQVCRALEAGKNVFVEKPLAILEPDLDRIAAVAGSASAPCLMVGYNRRYAPLVAEMRAFLDEVSGPCMLLYRANAGYVPREHWTQSSAEGGGRIVGEACHFLDLMIAITGERPIRVSAAGAPDLGRYNRDNVLATVEFDGGSVGTLCYAAMGDRAGGKERFEVFRGGRHAALDDFRSVRLAAGGKVKISKSRLRQDKGHRGEWLAVHESFPSGRSPISLDELIVGARCAFRIGDALRSGEPCVV